MSVYVDPLCSCLCNSHWKWTMACHLLADTIDELFDFAGKLGLKKDWIQNTRLPHFDLNGPMRQRAIQHGAIGVDRRKFVEFIRDLERR